LKTDTGNAQPSSKLRAWLWFVGLYVASLTAFLAVTGLLHYLIRA
jgi:hypothetical protein